MVILAGPVLTPARLLLRPAPAQLAILRRLAKYEPFNTIELRQLIAQRVIERGKYTLA